MSSRGIACVIVSYLSWATALSPSLGGELLNNFNLTFFKEAFPQNSVKAICQTSDGYLWFGTRFGLVRFDGINARVFDPGTDPPLEDDNCGRLLEDRVDHALWIGRRNRITRFKENHFTTFLIAPEDSGKVMQ